MIVVADEVINVLFVAEEWLEVFLDDFKKAVNVPSLIIDLIGNVPSSVINLEELLRKEINDILRTLAKVQEIEAMKLTARRFISIVENMEFSFLPSN